MRGQRLPISDNSVIEQSLGKYGILCIEDLIHEIYTVGEWCVRACVRARMSLRFCWRLVYVPVSVSMACICTVNIGVPRLGRLFPLCTVHCCITTAHCCITAACYCITAAYCCISTAHCCITAALQLHVTQQLGQVCAGYSASFLTPFLFTCGAGRHFKEANHFMWPFKLTSARGGYRQKTRHYQEGGDHGNREHLINGLIRRMN